MIARSVGKAGANQPQDVRLVKSLLAAWLGQIGKPALADGPTVDAAMIAAITDFQARVVKLPSPDGKLDPGGSTIKALEAFVRDLHAAKVTYGKGVDAADQLVGDYAIAVIRKALGIAGMSAAVITSTLRRPAEQAAIMYRNCVSNLPAQFALYGPTGDEVIAVYRDNRTLGEAKVIALMQQKIEDQLAQDRQVSRHVTTPQKYRTLNIIDLGVNSTRIAAGDSFDLAGLTAAFTRLKSEGYIREFIDETAKSNSCWHLEIRPGAKAI